MPVIHHEISFAIPSMRFQTLVLETKHSIYMKTFADTTLSTHLNIFISMYFTIIFWKLSEFLSLVGQWLPETA